MAREEKKKKEESEKRISNQNNKMKEEDKDKILSRIFTMIGTSATIILSLTLLGSAFAKSTSPPSLQQLRFFTLDSNEQTIREITEAVNAQETIILTPEEKYIAVVRTSSDIVTLVYRVTNGITKPWVSVPFVGDRVIIPVSYIVE